MSEDLTIFCAVFVCKWTDVPIMEEQSNSPSAGLSTESKQMGVMRLNDQKAGMQGLDVAKINQIIEEASKGSKFYVHKQKSQERIDIKIAEMKAALAKLTPEQISAARSKVWITMKFSFTVIESTFVS